MVNYRVGDGGVSAAAGLADHVELMFINGVALKPVPALPFCLHDYKHNRPHSAIGNQPPIRWLTDWPRQYS
jgi:transposase InsO family protein